MNSKKEKTIDILKNNLFKLLFADILSLIPIIIFTRLIFLIFSYNKVANNIYLLLLSIPFSYPFFIATNNVCYKIITKKNTTIIKDYITGLKENFFKSFIIGLIIYILASTLILSLNFYRQFAFINSFYWLFFGASIIIAILSIFFFFDVNAMIVIFDLKISSIIKNSLLSVFGEVKNNFISLIAIGFPIFVIYLSTFLNVYIFTALLILSSFIFLSIGPLIYINQLYYSFVKVISNKEESENKQNDIITEEEIAKLNLNTNDDEYIFYNGRMIKKSELNNMQ